MIRSIRLVTILALCALPLTAHAQDGEAPQMTREQALARNVAQMRGTLENEAGIDPSMSERYWSCVAWPIKAGTTGNRAFFINQQGQVMELRDSAYSGFTSAPGAGCALIGTDPNYMDSEMLASSVPGADGGTWTMVQ